MASKRKTPRRSVRKSAPSKQRSRGRHAWHANRKRPAKPAAGRRTLYPAIKPYNSGMLRVSRRARDLLRGMRQPEGQARAIRARRPRCRLRQSRPQLFRSGRVSHRAVRSARLRAQPAARQSGRQHDLASGRGHGAAARAPRHRALAGVRRLVGLDARPRLRADASRSASASWSCAASSCCRSSSCAGSTRKAPARCSPTAGRTTSPRSRPPSVGDLIQAFYKRLTSDDRATRVAAARAWSMWEAATSYLHVNEENLHKWGEEEFAIAVARIECHYFVNRGFLETRGSAAAQRDRDPQHPGRHRAGSLRRGVPDADGLGAAQALAGSGSAHRAGRRPLGVRARQHARADQRDRQVQVVSLHGRALVDDPVRHAATGARPRASCSNHALRRAEPERVAPRIHVAAHPLRPTPRTRPRAGSAGSRRHSLRRSRRPHRARAARDAHRPCR